MNDCVQFSRSRSFSAFRRTFIAQIHLRGIALRSQRDSDRDTGSAFSPAPPPPTYTHHHSVPIQPPTRRSTFRCEYRLVLLLQIKSRSFVCLEGLVVDVEISDDLIDREIMCCSVALVAHWAARVQMPKIFRRCSAFHLFPHACPDFGTSFSSRHWRAAAGPSRPSRSAVRRVPPPDFWVLESTGRENNIIQFLTQ